MGRSYQKGGLTVALEDTRTPSGTDAAAAPVGCPAHVPPDQFRHFDYIDDIESAPTPFDGYLQFRGEQICPARPCTPPGYPPAGGAPMRE